MAGFLSLTLGFTRVRLSPCRLWIDYQLLVVGVSVHVENESRRCPHCLESECSLHLRDAKGGLPSPSSIPDRLRLGIFR